MIDNPNETNCSYCIKRMNKLFSYYKESADESSKYTSFVFSLGYVTMVTIFQQFINICIIGQKDYLLFVYLSH